MNKINKVIKIENLPEEAMDALEDKYPDGWQDHVRKITKPNGSSFYAINIDTQTVSYLVKVEVNVDSSGEIEVLDEELIDTRAERAAQSHSKEDGNLEEDDENEHEHLEDDK